jgi:Cu/Ag efflux pump CusA
LIQLATIKAARGPGMIRNENGLLTGYVYIDIAGRDANGYVEEAARLLKEKLELPPGYAISWSGEYEAAQRVRERLWLVVPITLVLIFLLLYLNTSSIIKTMIILLAVPFSAIGAIWFLYFAGLQHERGRLGGPHCSSRGGCRDRGVHAPLPRLLTSRPGRKAASAVSPIFGRPSPRAPPNASGPSS